MRSPLDPGPPPAGVSLEVDGETTRIVVGASALRRLLGVFPALEPPSIQLTEERVWIDQPKSSTPAFIGTIRGAMAETADAGPRELQPIVDSLPLRAITRIRVRASHAARAQLVIEAEAGRLEFSAPGAGTKELEWVRQYLESRLETP